MHPGEGTGATAANFDTEEPTPRGADDSRSLGEIVSDVANDLSTLVRQELDLAKTEAKQEMSRAGKGAGMLGGAGVAGHLFLLLASFALAFGLDEVMPLWLATLIVALIWAIVAAVLASMGRKALKESNPQLPKTQQSLREDASWAKQQTS